METKDLLTQDNMKWKYLQAEPVHSLVRNHERDGSTRFQYGEAASALMT